MFHEMKQKTRNTIWIGIFAICYIGLQMIIFHQEARGNNIFNGVIMSFQYGLCLLMMRENRKKGVLTATVLVTFSLLMMLRAIFHLKFVAALPGFCNASFYLITVLMLNVFYENREKESVTDILTGFMNRRGLYKELQDKIEDENPFHVIYMSLDNFKFINDNYGHAYGDALLQQLTKRIHQLLGDDVEISRIGGSEFVLLVDGKRNAMDTANMVLDTVREKVTLVVNNTTIDCYMSCYAGLASFPEDAADYESLIKKADIAMCDAISVKSKTALCFNESTAEYINRQIELEKLIKDGLKNDYFYLVYQPQYHMEGKRLRGFESLLRMKTPGGQIVSPGEFIPVAEKGELILQIDEYVLRRAMREFKELVEKNKDLTVSVNVSAKNIGSETFIEKMERFLKETGFPAHNLEIEITEYCMMKSVKTAIENIKKLHELGVRIALDDFGTGYTSLNYVAKLPVNLLKVDKSLVDDIEKDSKGREFVQAVIAMGHLMGCEVISEGVEEESQIAKLKEDGCDMIQGFVWGKPLAYNIAKKMAFE